MKKFFIIAALCLLTAMLLGVAAAEACEHTERFEVEVEQEPVFTTIDASTHRVTVDVMIYSECVNCGERFSGHPGQSYSYEESHSWHGGACFECGFVCQHPSAHPDVDAENYEFITYTYEDTGDNMEHIVRGQIGKGKQVCDICNEALYFESDSDIVTTLEYHYYDEKGVCADCGHENSCRHENLTSYRVIEDVVSYEDTGSDLKHNAQCCVSTSHYCEDCGMDFPGSLQECLVTMELYHYYDENGVCEDCGHVNQCQHAHVKEGSSYSGGAYDYGSHKYHYIVGDEVTYKVCEDCGTEIGETTSKNGKYKVKHDFDKKGMCMMCGHVKPAEPTPATPTSSSSSSASEEENELTYTSVDSLNGVSASDNLTLAQALDKIGTAMDESGAKLDIPGMNALLTADEKTAFDALSARDRLMVTACALGLKDQLPEDAMTEDAAALADAVAERLSALPEDELKALCAPVADCFPVELLMLDGVETFDLDLTDNDVNERYTFTRTAEDWILTGTAVGK